MEAIIEAAFLNKVKRIVVTSSDTAVLGSLWKSNIKGVESTNIYTDEDICPID